jgi:hypothetical protein
LELKALDTSSFVRSKTFFYVGFGFAHAVAIGGLIVMHRRKRVWEYQVGQDAAGEEAKEAAEESVSLLRDPQRLPGSISDLVFSFRRAA